MSEMTLIEVEIALRQMKHNSTLEEHRSTHEMIKVRGPRLPESGQVANK